MAQSSAKKPIEHEGAGLSGAVARGAELSEEALRSIETGQRAAILAVRKFVDTVDEVLPAVGERPSRREVVIDSALEMAERMVTMQYEFLRSVVRSADRAMSTSGAADDEAPATRRDR